MRYLSTNLSTMWPGPLGETIGWTEQIPPNKYEAICSARAHKLCPPKRNVPITCPKNRPSASSTNYKEPRELPTNENRCWKYHLLMSSKYAKKDMFVIRDPAQIFVLFFLKKVCLQNILKKFQAALHCCHYFVYCIGVLLKYLFCFDFRICWHSVNKNA